MKDKFTTICKYIEGVGLLRSIQWEDPDSKSVSNQIVNLYYCLLLHPGTTWLETTIRETFYSKNVHKDVEKSC